jgi:broad specificity phosphatase PhoE
MNNTLLFLRHGQTGPAYDAKDPKKVLGISEWLLTEDGKRQSEEAAKNAEFDDVDLIVISTEKKAWDTAQPLIKRLQAAGKKFEIVQSDHIAELDRDKGGYLAKEPYEAAAKEALTHRDVPIRTEHGEWETANHALERFTKGVGMIDAEYSNKKILFIGHGYTTGMYFAQQEKTLDEQNLYERVHKIPLCAWGKVKNGEVLHSVFPKMEERIGEKMV